MGLRQKILIYILSVTLMYALYFWGIPAAFNVEKNISKYEKLIIEKTGYNLNIVNPHLKMGLFPSIWLSADEFNLLNKDKTSALNINNPKIEISVFRFLLGKCNINYFSADDLKANFRYSKDEKLFIGDYLIPVEEKSSLDIYNIKLNLQDYMINMKDEAVNQNSSIVGDYLIIDKFIPNKHYKICSSAELNLGNKISNVNFDINLKMPLLSNLSKKDNSVNITVTNFDMGRLSKIVSYLTDKEYSNLAGILNLEVHTKHLQSNNQFIVNLVLEKFGINGKYFALPYYYKGRVNLSSECTASGKNLTIDDFKFLTDNLNLDINGIVHKINTSKPYFDINLRTKNAKAEKLVELLPANNKFYEELEFDIETLVKSKFFANVDMDLNVKGNSATPDVNGDLKITQAYVTTRPISNGAKKADINLKFKKDRILMDVMVPAAPDQYVTVGGFVELYGKKDVEVIVKSSNNVDLGIAQYVLMPVHKVLNFELGPVPIMDIDGFGNIDLVVKGNKYDPHAFGVFNFNKGTVSFNDVHNMVFKNASGNLKFDDTNTVFTTKYAELNGKPITVNGTCKLTGDLDFDVNTNNQPAKNLMTTIKSSPMLSDIGTKLNEFDVLSGFADINFKLYGKVTNTYDIKFGKNIFAKGTISLHNISSSISKLKLGMTNLNGKIDFDNFDLKLSLESAISKSVIKISGYIKDNIADLKINSENMNADDIIYYLSNGDIIPVSKHSRDRKSLISFTASYSGDIDKIDYSKLKADGFADFRNYRVIYKPYNSYIDITNGNFIIKNDYLNFNNVNLKIDNMSAFISGKIKNIFEEPYFNVYILTKLNQSFADKIFNKKSIYPLKVRGDISNSMNLSGNINDINLSSTLNIGANSKIYYMGASLGDEINPIVINFDGNIKNKKNIIIKDFTKDVLLRTNTNKTHLNRDLVVSGALQVSNNDLYFNNLKLKTLSSNDARIFNIIFKKPMIKDGSFNSDLIINGSVKYPRIIGKLSINNISIPDYFINIKNTSINFQHKFADINSGGVLFGEEFSFKAEMENKFKQPYIFDDIKFFVKNIDLNSLLSNIQSIEMNSEDKLAPISDLSNMISPVVVKNAQLTTEKVIIDKLILNDFSATANITPERIFNLNSFKFYIADGLIKGKYVLNTKNMTNNIFLNIENVEAGEFTEMFFNLKNQISGNLNGEMSITCKGIEQEDCLKTVSGRGGFKITNGKMPKLGSMEYLLNAANLVKGGITGLSLNGLIDLITPLRTGEFDSIMGNIEMNNGRVNNLQIYSQGKNLNLFITGKIDLRTSIADMKIFGRLLKNSSTILGPIGNASLNTLFNTIPWIDLSKISDNTFIESINKIPGVDLSNNKYRIFSVDINGDINGNDYVKSFKWVE